MPEQDLHSRIKAEHSIPHQVHTATTTNGATHDMKGFESIEYIVNVALAIDGDFTVALEQAPDDGTGSPGAFAAVPAAEVLGTNPVVIVTADELSVARIGSVGKERFQRAVLTETAANTVGVVGVTAILGHPRNAPVAGQATA